MRLSQKPFPPCTDLKCVHFYYQISHLLNAKRLQSLKTHQQMRDALFPLLQLLTPVAFNYVNTHGGILTALGNCYQYSKGCHRQTVVREALTAWVFPMSSMISLPVVPGDAPFHFSHGASYLLSTFWLVNGQATIICYCDDHNDF